MTIALKKNVPGFRDANGVFRPIRSASYVGGGTSRRKATVKDRKKYSRAKAGDLGPQRQERALEDVFSREIRLQNEEKAARTREQARIEKEIEREIYGETSGRMSSGKAVTLAQFVRGEGGIRRTFRHGGKSARGKRSSWDKGEIDRLSPKETGTTGLTTSRQDRGKTLDGMFQAAREAGYDVTSIDDLMQRVENEVGGGKATYSTHGLMTYNPKTKNPVRQDTAATLRQLGGNKFLAMTGAKVHSTLENLSLKIPKAKNGITHVVIDLNGRDLYDIRFISFRNFKLKDVAVVKDVYADQLRSIFEEYTGLRTSLSANPIRVLKHKFYVGQKLATRMITDNDIIVRGTVISRTPKFVTVKVEGERTPKRCGVSVWSDAETIFPDGRYSMATSFNAKDDDQGRVRNPAAKNPIARYKVGDHVRYITGGEVMEIVEIFNNSLKPGTFRPGYSVKGLESGNEHNSTGAGFTKAKKNPDLLGMFANAAVGIASTLQINEMVKSRKRKAAPKKRGTTTAKRRNPLAGEGKGSVIAAKKLFTEKLAAIRDYPSRDVIGSAGSLIGYITDTASGKAALRKRIKAATAAGLKKHPTASGRSVNPTQPKVRAKGDLYVLTIGSGDDLISVYLHDGDKDGFSRRFKTMAAARAYATRNKVKMLENPAAAKVNGLISRAWARSRAKSEYGRELRLAAAAERSRKRRSKFEGQARANPAGYVLTAKKGDSTFSPGYAAIHETISTYAAAMRRRTALEKQGFMVSVRHAELKNPRRSASGKTTAVRATNGKKAVARSAKPYKFKQGDRVTATSGPHKGKSFTIHAGSHSLGKPVYSVREVVTTQGVRSSWQFPERGLKFAAKAKARKPKANPKSTARRRTFEMFQGRKVTTARPMMVSNHAPANLDALGDLIELKIAGGPSLKFNGKGTKLCAANSKLWIAGKRFAKANPAAKANELNPIGEIEHVVYGTRKPHHGDHDYTHYIHKLGEESGRRPILCVDREGFPVIRGGNYKIEARGIVD